LDDALPTQLNDNDTFVSSCYDSILLNRLYFSRFYKLLLKQSDIRVTLYVGDHLDRRVLQRYIQFFCDWRSEAVTQIFLWHTILKFQPQSKFLLYA